MLDKTYGLQIYLIMAEDGHHTHVYNIAAQTVNVNAQHGVQNINVEHSFIQEIQVTTSGHLPQAVEQGENVEADSAARIPQRLSSDADIGGASSGGNKHYKRNPRLSPHAPTGPGWVKLSEKIYMYNKQPLKVNTAVYKGKQACAGKWRDVAVKMIPYNDKNFKEVKLHLELEEHPNIVRMLEADEIHQGFLPYIYIVMELCSQTLKDFIEEGKQTPFDFVQRFSYAKQIISGVAFIHEKNIIHRDIKLENVLLTSSKTHIRVADFGLSKELEVGHSVDSVSSRGLGSDGYRAPEIHHEKPTASFRSDSFAIGVVLSMLFSNGQHPFGSDPVRWRTNIIDNKGFDLSNVFHFNEPYSEKRNQILDLISKALSHNPQDRPTPKEMLQHPFFIAIPGFQAQNDYAKEDRVKFLEDKLRKSFGTLGYEKSLAYVQELRSLKGSDDLSILLSLAECQIYLKSDDLKQTMENIASFISAAGSANEARAIAKSLQVKRRNIQALILFKLCHNIRIKEEATSPNDELTWIRGLINDIKHVVAALVKAHGRSRAIANEFGIKFMEEMLKDLRAGQRSNPNVKASTEFDCLLDLAEVYDLQRKYDKCIVKFQEAQTIMVQQFGENAPPCKGYGWLCQSLGIAYSKLGQYFEAKHSFVTALEVQEKASDYANENEKQERMAITKRNLDIVQKNLADMTDGQTTRL